MAGTMLEIIMVEIPLVEQQEVTTQVPPTHQSGLNIYVKLLFNISLILFNNFDTNFFEFSKGLSFGSRNSY